jgi:hypothetical protein
MKATTALATALALAATLSAPAAEVVKPNIGEPLRDAAVTRAPDGTYYLTGTRAMNREFWWNPEIRKEEYTKPEITRTSDGAPDFMSNDGVKLWSSKDLVEWKDEGLVVDLMERRQWHNGMNSFYSMPDRPLGSEPVRGWTAPRLQKIGEDWYLIASNGGCDVRWFKASKPQGPFVDAWKDTEGVHQEMGPLRGPGHGMLFRDLDGATWRIRGHGNAERMLSDLSNVERGRSVFLLGRVAGYPNAEWCAGQFDPRAAAVTLVGGKYILTWAACTDEAGFKRDDSFYALADKFEGPYSEPRLLLAGSGPVVLFDAGERGLMASCSVGDAPVLAPVKFEAGALAAQALPEVPPVAKAPKAGKPAMFEYADAKPSGKRAERAGEEVKYSMLPVFADREAAAVERVGRRNPVPLFDVPMQDVSVCKGGDGAWYLTGGVASRKDEGADFQNNDGIYLWRSDDLDTWKPIGKVWDIGKDGSAWAKQYRIPGDNLLREDFCRGVTAPEIHFLEGDYYLAYSMNGRGTGLLKSKTGKPEGPYEDLGRITGMGESPSLFADAGSAKRYWLWGKGLQIADLRRDGNATLAGSARDILSDIFLPKGSSAAHNALGMRGVTGPFLFTYHDAEVKRIRYALASSAVTHTWNRANRDAVVVVADQLDGIWKGGASRMIPNGGQTTVFPGPSTTPGQTGELLATFWGADPTAVWRDRPGIVPMESWRPGPYHDMAADPMRYPRKVHGDYFTHRGPWATLMPPKGFEFLGQRDPDVFAAADGYLYYSASPSRFGNQPNFKWEGLPYWRAKEIAGPWDLVGYLYTMEQMRDDPGWPAIGEKYKHWNDGRGAWEPSMSYGKGTHWITIWFGGTGWGKDVCWKQSVPVLLRSTSGKPQGPYAMHMVSPLNNLQGVFWDDDGTAYGLTDGPIFRFTDDLRKVDTTWTHRDGTPLRSFGDDPSARGVNPRTADGRSITEDCNLLVSKIDGRYVARGLTGMSSYDGLFWYADDIRGPYRYMGVVPFLGNSSLFRDRSGRWFTVTQSADAEYFFESPYRSTDKYNSNLVVYEVAVDAKSDKPSVWPTHDLGHLDEAVYRK